MQDTGQAFSREAGWRSTLAPCTATSKTSSGRTFLAPTETDEAADPSEAISAVGRVLVWLIFGTARGVAEGSAIGSPSPVTVAVLVSLLVDFGQVTLQEVVAATNTEYLSVCCTCTRLLRINTCTSTSRSARPCVGDDGSSSRSCDTAAEEEVLLLGLRVSRRGREVRWVSVFSFRYVPGSRSRFAVRGSRCPFRFSFRFVEPPRPVTSHHA